MIAKKDAPAAVTRQTGAKRKYYHPYNSTIHRKMQAQKQHRREVIAEWLALPITLVLLGGIFWGFWLLRGVML